MQQSGTYPLRRRGSHPGHGPTRSDSRPALHPFQFAPPQSAPPVPQNSPYGPEYLPMNPPTPMFAVNPLAGPPALGGAFPGAPGYAPAVPQPQPVLGGYRPAAPQPVAPAMNMNGRPAMGTPWPSDPAYGAPPPWWGYRPDQAVHDSLSPSPSDFAPTVHPLFN
ncbi:hypothetical protein FRB90_008611, partial [Tulasnella sp. 427]